MRVKNQIAETHNPVSPITAGETPVSFNATTHVFVNTPATCIEIVYTVLLNVTDDKGDKGTASQQVRVIEAPAPGSSQCR